MIKTIKLKADEFLNIDDIKPLPYFLIGGRGTGKSYLVKNYVKDLLLSSNFEKKYLYVRINARELATHDSWLQESGLLEALPFSVDEVRIKRGIPYAGAVSLVYKEKADDLDRLTRPKLNPHSVKAFKQIGYVASLESSALIKSADYSDVNCIVFEEFIRRGMSKKTIELYCFNFAELLETTLRGRKVPVFFIANSLNAYNPLFDLFEDKQIFKIYTEQRRTNYKAGAFSRYLEGETYHTGNYNLADFIYLTTIKMNNGQPLSFYCDKYTYTDILITGKNNNSKPYTNIFYMLQREFLYNFEVMSFIFDNDKTEIFFYTNTDKIREKLRNKYQRLTG